MSDSLDKKVQETADQLVSLLNPGVGRIALSDANYKLWSEQQINLTFHQNDKQVGRLWFDKETETWHFDGDKEKSAIEFVAWLRVTFKQQLKAPHDGSRHQVLHAALDELLACFITENQREHGFLSKPIEELINWSHAMTLHPTCEEKKND